MEKMDKSKMFDDVSLKGDSSRGRFLILCIAVLLLAVAFVVMVSGGVWYINHLDNTEQAESKTDEIFHPNTSPREFYVGVPRMEITQEFMVSQYVYIDEEQRLEYVVFKDPDMLHIQDMVFIDHNNDLQILYGSETAECLFVKDTTHSFNDNLQYLYQHNGRNVSTPSTDHIYKYGERVSRMVDIPTQMSAFCTLTNSHWLDVAPSHPWLPEQKWRVCICTYSYCWCTFCADHLCWGRCCHCQLEAQSAYA